MNNSFAVSLSFCVCVWRHVLIPSVLLLIPFVKRERVINQI